MASSLPFWITRMEPVFSTTNSRCVSPGGAVTPRGCESPDAMSFSLTVGTGTRGAAAVVALGVWAAARLPSLADTSTYGRQGAAGHHADRRPGEQSARSHASTSGR